MSICHSMNSLEQHGRIKKIANQTQKHLKCFLLKLTVFLKQMNMNVKNKVQHKKTNSKHLEQKVLWMNKKKHEKKPSKIVIIHMLLN